TPPRPDAPPPLREGQAVHLQPVPPEQIAQALAAPGEFSTARLPAATEFSAQISAQNAQSDIIRQTTQIFTPQSETVPSKIPLPQRGRAGVGGYDVTFIETVTPPPTPSQREGGILKSP